MDPGGVIEGVSLYLGLVCIERSPRSWGRDCRVLGSKKAIKNHGYGELELGGSCWLDTLGQGQTGLGRRNVDD